MELGVSGLFFLDSASIYIVVIRLFISVCYGLGIFIFRIIRC